MNCYMIFTGPPWRMLKLYTVARKIDIKQKILLPQLMWALLIPPSKLLGILQRKEKSLFLTLLLFFFKHSFWHYLWNFRKLIPKESAPGYSTVKIGVTLMLKLSWFNFKAAPPWGPLSPGRSDVFLPSVRARIIFNLLDTLQRSIYSLTVMVRTRVWGQVKRELPVAD